MNLSARRIDIANLVAVEKYAICIIGTVFRANKPEIVIAGQLLADAGTMELHAC